LSRRTGERKKKGYFSRRDAKKRKILSADDADNADLKDKKIDRIYGIILIKFKISNFRFQRENITTDFTDYTD